MITDLQDNEVFVFGSNLLGHHAGGAAKQAHEQFGAKWGVGEGLTGQCYAFPTLDEDMQKVSAEAFAVSVRKLRDTANNMPEMTFLLTKVGCGIAGFDEEWVCSQFTDMPSNVRLPKEWAYEPEQ